MHTLAMKTLLVIPLGYKEKLLGLIDPSLTII